MKSCIQGTAFDSIKIGTNVVMIVTLKLVASSGSLGVAVGDGPSHGAVWGLDSKPIPASLNRPARLAKKSSANLADTAHQGCPTKLKIALFIVIVVGYSEAGADSIGREGGVGTGVFSVLTPRTVQNNCGFCKCSGRGARPLLRLGPVPRPYVISANRTRV